VLFNLVLGHFFTFYYSSIDSLHCSQAAQSAHHPALRTETRDLVVPIYLFIYFQGASSARDNDRASCRNRFLLRTQGQFHHHFMSLHRPCSCFIHVTSLTSSQHSQSSGDSKPTIANLSIIPYFSYEPHQRVRHRVRTFGNSASRRHDDRILLFVRYFSFPCVDRFVAFFLSPEFQPEQSTVFRFSPSFTSFFPEGTISIATHEHNCSIAAAHQARQANWNQWTGHGDG